MSSADECEEDDEQQGEEDRDAGGDEADDQADVGARSTSWGPAGGSRYVVYEVAGRLRSLR